MWSKVGYVKIDSFTNASNQFYFFLKFSYTNDRMFRIELYIIQQVDLIW